MPARCGRRSRLFVQKVTSAADLNPGLGRAVERRLASGMTRMPVADLPLSPSPAFNGVTVWCWMWGFQRDARGEGGEEWRWREAVHLCPHSPPLLFSKLFLFNVKSVQESQTDRQREGGGGGCLRRQD
ncbi:hypothetical protein EYF80_015089 [Liparis tanakae]|uniref:Uncharacterized protein n=1 Tax=Liparis tanakae TaxID=230148 RepID=A0A4Z2IAI4_9TELE|nr:hypothetical protein EYF80_015089 [Liparis tanakae]